MFWDDLIRRLRRDVGGLSPRLMSAAAGHVAVLPAPRARRRMRWSWLVLLALFLALVLLFANGHARAIVAALPF